ALAFFVFVIGALVPFSYLLKRLTGRPPTRHKVFVVILFMGWIAIFLERIMLVFPSMSPNNQIPLGPVELLITAGFFSLFMLSRRGFLGGYRPALDQPKYPRRPHPPAIPAGTGRGAVHCGRLC